MIISAFVPFFQLSYGKYRATLYSIQLVMVLVLSVPSKRKHRRWELIFLAGDFLNSNFNIVLEWWIIKIFFNSYLLNLYVALFYTYTFLEGEWEYCITLFIRLIDSVVPETNFENRSEKLYFNWPKSRICDNDLWFSQSSEVHRISYTKMLLMWTR